MLGRLTKKVHDYGTLVMFSHTIFSLSFALIAMILAGGGSLPSPDLLFWILVTLVSARTGANAINRVIDAEIDAKNPRTATRQIPRGLMNKKEVTVFSIVCFAIMIYGAYRLNPLCLFLSPAALFLMLTYSYTKRFTWLCHLYLGFTVAAAPVGAWIAVTGTLSWLPLFMGAANMFWVAGFDIIYGSQDYEFDRKNGVYSIPAKFGVRFALAIAAFFHIMTLFLLVFIGLISSQLGTVYFIGIMFIAVLFILEHKIVSPKNLTNVKIASYGINQLISFVFIVTGTIAALF